MVAFAEHMPLIDHLLPHAFLPQLLGSAGLWPDPGPPVQPLEAHHHGPQRLPLAIIDVIEGDPITILGHLLTTKERVLFLGPALGEVVW